MEAEGIDFLQFAFRWVNCLLIREVPFGAALRLWDTYLAEGPRFNEFLVRQQATTPHEHARGGCCTYNIQGVKGKAKAKLIAELILMGRHPCCMSRCSRCNQTVV
jgi:hypothetical protein